MKYTTYGVNVDSKGNYAFGPERIANSRREAAAQRSSLCSKMHGKDRVYKRAITYRFGQLFKLQDIA